MAYQKELIVKKASELFHRFGIRSVSIDDICKELGMSKKTFYQHFAAKEDLVAAMLHASGERMQLRMDQWVDELSFEKLLAMLTEFLQKNPEDVRCIPTLVYDLQKYYPKQFADFQQRAFERQKKGMMQMLQHGMESGYVRANINIELTAILFAKIHNDVIRDAESLEAMNVPMTQLSRQTLDILVRGVLTGKGLETMHDA